MSSGFFEDEFLRLIEAYEALDQGPKKPLRSLFHKDFDFPPTEDLKEAELSEKLDTIRAILSEHHIFLDLRPALPASILYKYLVEEVIPQEEIFEDPLGFRLHIDGCDGLCPNCFQKDYCETAEEQKL